ncbi:fimbrillin family protein [Parasphaerochaeta coccoides]|uniref:Listeria/Bacterioides repeat-containing protein n=1 Tax=Parasphaerochaeta coccoides (strain ATCC BAA-1237 / DSM 17374 / SPN1) TaxID=760011 RepID=F4GJ01_PARC1|nr:fimbrillin family protein [Parasphaerochaeta coccoides]AEC01296.1 Listeria/Bacterioides repeat-containing protein [Parasphaerochaeta coccoides DSM 17374]
MVILTILVLLVAFVSCVDKPNVSNSNTIRFISEIGRKATADSGWSIGDEVGIYMVEAGEDVATVATTDRDNVQYVADTADITFSGFSPVDASNPLKWDDISTPAITEFDFIAYYPYASSIADTTALPIHVYPGSGEQDTGKADFLWGKKAGVQNNTSTVSLTLSHALSRLVVNVGPSTTVDKDAITGGTLVATVTGINTQATIDLDSGDVAPVVPSDIDVVMKDISGTLTDAERTAGKRRYEAVLIPTDNTTALSSLGLRFTLGGETYEWAASSVASSDEYRIVLESGKTHVYNMTLNTAADEVAVAEILIGIVDWDTGSGVNAAATKAYSLTFDANSATGGSAPGRMYAHEGSQVTLPSPGTLEKNLHYVYGWNTLPDGNGTQYAASESFTMPAHDVTLYARWVPKVKSVSAGYGHTVILAEDGTLWATGWNIYGQLGDGTSGYLNSKSTPVRVKASINPDDFMTNVEAVSAGDYHTMILKEDGTLWATGWDQDGQLGINSITTYTGIPTKVTNTNIGEIPIIRSVATGSRHTMLVSTDDRLWGTGRNNDGQLGLGHLETPVGLPRQVKFTSGPEPFPTVASVATGANHTMIVDTDGKLWATGNNAMGQLGDGTAGSGANKNLVVPVTTTSTGTLPAIASVIAGAYHTMIVDTNGMLWATGDNSSGQLGDTTMDERTIPVPITTTSTGTLPAIASVAAGDTHTMIVDTNGILWATGNNEYGQLGDGTSGAANNKSTLVQVMTDVAAVYAGCFHTMIVKKDGTLWATGSNFNGQLGLGDSSSGTDIKTPVQVIF